MFGRLMFVLFNNNVFAEPRGMQCSDYHVKLLESGTIWGHGKAIILLLNNTKIHHLFH